MISLFKLHFHYLFSWKVVYATLIIILVSLISYLLFSRFYLDNNLLVFNAEYYRIEYYFESLNYLKFLIIIYNLFLVINSFAINKYDIFLLIRRSKKQIITSKIIVLFIGSTVLIIILYLIFLIIGLYLTPYMQISFKDLAILGDLIIFSEAYLLIYITTYLYSNSIYNLLTIIVGFFISDLMIDYNSLKNNASTIAKGLNLVFISIGYYQKTGYTLYYGEIYGILLITVLFVIILRKYLNSDF